MLSLMSSAITLSGPTCANPFWNVIIELKISLQIQTRLSGNNGKLFDVFWVVEAQIIGYVS